MSVFDKIDITIEAQPCELKDLEGNLLINEDGTTPTISAVGTDSSKFREAIRELNEDDEFSGETLLAKCTISWENMPKEQKSVNGQIVEIAPECNFENALELYKRYPVIKSQIDAFIGKRGNFLKNA